MNAIKGKVSESISTIIIVAPLEAIMKPTEAQAIWKNSNNSHRLGAGGRHGQQQQQQHKLYLHDYNYVVTVLQKL